MMVVALLHPYGLLPREIFPINLQYEDYCQGFGVWSWMERIRTLTKYRNRNWMQAL